MKYTGQEAGEITLLPGEIKGLVFTESDRRQAKATIVEVIDGEQPDEAVVSRLVELSIYGRSHQAEVLLGQIYAKELNIK